MAKKGKTSGSNKPSNANQKPNIPCFCYCCGTKVQIGQLNCTNKNCFSHETKSNFANADKKFCAHCQEFVTININKTCSNCNHKLHGAIANNKKYTYH